jgi:hypothetical protein
MESKGSSSSNAITPLNGAIDAANQCRHQGVEAVAAAFDVDSDLC